MILIQTKKDDFTSSLVAQWLCCNDKDFVRINDVSLIRNFRLKNNQLLFEINERTINIFDLKHYWYRRGSFSLNEKSGVKTGKINRGFENYNKGEDATLIQILNSYLLNVKSIGNYTTSKINKILVCDLAMQIGFKVPKYLITNNKDDLLDFFNEHLKIITKSLYGLPGFSSEEKYFVAKTHVVTLNDIEKSGFKFRSSLFQEYIEKRIEIRTFFLNEEFYSSAIFSQNDEKTKIDFRNYNRSKPNRVVPYKLPDKIIEQLRTINNKLNLNSGSYDLILTPQNEYYLLEVNPIGQFAQISLPCNYYIERKVAREISDE
ncbi:grasp-with-spasm system ATP-grasp peptide maturase [Flavobacterium tructae]|uniref:grasp-with-spasm system ATP-grasp peptide maturase n=1 Tax=Flavobacterium tructae TaxID=1114873 RepID=UPI002551D6D6|nr:grasp-with-spasm system ATP-grasp peptide maturase [Flavobacterium tructae]MDL2141416.1 grasp-with-spasm system ATP-grasp peptide maturase [Flavobacterium tructae]